MKELLLVLFCYSFVLGVLVAEDTIKTSQLVKDGATVVSAGGNFELGFFSPKNSVNRYVGIWYKKVSTGTLVWVANRNNPVNEKSRVLTLTDQGNLNIIVNLTSAVIWSSNSSTSDKKIDAVAQLLDTGNLVVKDVNDNNVLWQSFDYPTDTLLAGMKFGIDKVTGLDRFLTSWKSNDDPGTGDYTYRCHPQGFPQFFIADGSKEIYRLGNWNGIIFSGFPRPISNISLSFVFTDKEVYYMYNLVNTSIFTRLVLTQNGVAVRQTWAEKSKNWVVFLNGPTDICDNYGKCGKFGSCNIANAEVCECLKKFKPKSPKDWTVGDFSDGCVRETSLDCQKGDGFLEYSNIKLPDTESCRSYESMNLKDCEILCSKNCSCTAYTTLDISKGSGCLLWFDELIDIRQAPQGGGQFIYIRMAASELGGSKGKKKGTVIIVSLIFSIGALMLGLSLIIYLLKKKKNKRQEGRFTLDTEQFQSKESQQEDLELPLIDFLAIEKATNYFSLNNILGEGGFGPVYKGLLEDGREIAVKRLSKTSRQGTNEFKNEVVCIAKLQHRNLVKLLGCCIQEEEMMLIYEYLPNKGLDFFIFDEERSKLLDWPTRFSIINGIARGLLYLHQDSRLRIIHRDLKVSNILLDKDLNPKISDFGMARIFGGDETQANTRRVVGTYGYMSPEYQLDGLFSVKSDVFSFGVLVLEIVSGKRNRGFFHTDHHHNLLGHAWNLFKEGMPEELIDGQISYKGHLSEVVRSIHIGLLCVQQDPEDRPSMSYVVMTLGSEVVLPQPKQPGFFLERNKFVSETSSSQTMSLSCNDMSITLLDAR
ncbi:Receptor-like serine/threonine-protein kinase [Heracleum sosnowskyi]|uniref:Receptor-like serine/threonine-protein kinase n=1 Tax=Heracleum sosnowskyi TaxID=360622 RepID=A0AAD8MVL0_9APIA|nr:Receptor-like serine/threonine-protein kinase [Heracleum sosnowskyi]